MTGGSIFSEVLGDTPSQGFKLMDRASLAEFVGMFDSVIKGSDQFRGESFPDVSAMNERPHDGSQGEMRCRVHCGTIA